MRPQAPVSGEDRGGRQRGERRLAALTPEQYKARFAQAQAAMVRQYPAMGRLLSQQGSQLHEKTVRGWMIRQLQDEPMDLLVIVKIWTPGPK